MKSFRASKGIIMKRRSSFTRTRPKRKCTIKKDSASVKDATTILALNDDCLVEVFDHLNLLDLCAVADVCNRFRQNAKACFEYSKKKNLDLLNDIRSYGETLNHVISKTSKVLRHFGEFIVEFKDGGVCDQYPFGSLESRQIYWRKINELIVRYCSQNLMELQLSNFDLNYDNALMIEPLISRLHKLTLHRCEIQGILAALWPSWCKELRELRFESVSARRPFESLHQSFPKLLEIALLNVKGLKNDNVDRMLKSNPQLKEFQIFDTYYSTQRLLTLPSILRSLAKHVPEIESLNIRLDGKVPGSQRSVKYFGQLSKLISLTLDTFTHQSSEIVTVLSEIATATIPLKHLYLCGMRFHSVVDSFVDVVSKLKHLETLTLSGSDITAPQLLKICKRCSEISTLHTFGEFFPKVEDIIEIIRHSKKLRLLAIKLYAHSDDTFCVDAEIYRELLKIVENRSEKTRLEIVLDDIYYTLNFPNDLVRAHRESLSIIVSQKHYPLC